MWLGLVAYSTITLIQDDTWSLLQEEILLSFCLKWHCPGVSTLEWTWAQAWLKHSSKRPIYSRCVSVTQVPPLGNVRSFSPTDNCDCLDSDLPRNASHRWREREHGGWMMEIDFTVSYRPQHNRALNISSVGWCVLVDMFVGLYECECTLWTRVCLSATHAACGSYTGIVRTRQGALFPLCLPGAAFHPRWAGRQARLAAGLAFSGWLG